MFGAAYAFKKIYLQNGLQTTMYSTLSDEELESSVFISVYTISHDSGNTSDTDSNESGQSSWAGLTYIADHPDTTFSDFLDDRSSDEEPFNEDNMYGLDHMMTVGEDFTEFLRTMKASLDNMSAMAIEISRAMGIDVTSFEVEE
ncbi:hypothetical protein V8E53_012744 [Lactarius tabidus]